MSELTTLPTPDRHPVQGLAEAISDSAGDAAIELRTDHRPGRNPSYGCASPLLTKTASAAVFMLQVKKLDTDETVH